MPIDKDPYGRRTLDFIDKLRSLTDFNEVSQAIFKEIEWFGFDCVSILTMPGPEPADLRERILLNTRPPEFTQRYIEKNYVAYDPVLKEVRKDFNSYSWTDIRRLGGLNKIEREILDEPTEFGLFDGLAVPNLTRSGAVTMFGPCGADPDLSPRARSAIELIGMYSVSALESARRKEAVHRPKQSRLSTREREIMQWVATGRSDDEIGQILGLTARTVNWHVENAKQKLDAYRRTYAVVQAIRLGEISL